MSQFPIDIIPAQQAITQGDIDLAAVRRLGPVIDNDPGTLQDRGEEFLFAGCIGADGIDMGPLRYVF